MEGQFRESGVVLSNEVTRRSFLGFTDTIRSEGEPIMYISTISGLGN